MTKIVVDITSCKECPFFVKERYWTEDSWEHAYDWFCMGDGKKKKISGYVGWYDEKDIKIPEWCPKQLK